MFVREEATKLNPFIELRRQLHQIPELGFQEHKTQQLLLDYLHTLPNERLQIQTWRTGILVRISGLQPRQCIGYRTDMDGLPLTEETSYPFPSQHAGQMHACGHDLHMAIALGILTYFAHHPIDDDLLFIFQPAEEGPGGALPLRNSPEFKQWKPDQIYALHIAPEYPVGTIATKPGILFANTSEFHIHLVGQSGHAAYPHQGNDMVVALTQLISQLQTIIPRNTNPIDAAILNIGKIEAGQKENVIAGSGSLHGTIRTLSPATMANIKERIKQIVAGIAISFQCDTKLNWGSNYSQVNNDPAVTRLFMNWANEQTDWQLIECREAMTGEDFGYFLEQIPGMMFWLGVETPYGLHHPQIEPDERAIPLAIHLLTNYFMTLSSNKYEFIRNN